MKQVLVLIFGFLLISPYCAAQTGYNYARPEVTIGGNNNLQASGNTAVRPIVGGFPTAATAAGAFPTAATAYGVTGGAGIGGAVSPTTAYAGFPAQAQLGGNTGSVFNPGASAVVPATAYAAGQKRPNLQQRPTSGIYGSAISQQQFAGGAAGPSPTSTGSGLEGDYAEGDYSAVPGLAGVNYPVYAEVPPTNFDCAQQALPGYYSDVEAQCQVFHICALNRTYSFLCPNGTIFSQETLVCVWWNQYDCVSAPSLYANNAFIYDYGNQGPPAATGGYQPNVGIGSVSPNRPQTNFQSIANAARTSSTAAGPGIYGAGSLRPNVPANAYTGGQAAFPTAAGNTAAGRYAPNPTAQAAAYPTGPPTTATATPFGPTIRNEGYPNAIQETAYAAAQVSPKSANREYLPPRRP